MLKRKDRSTVALILTLSLMVFSGCGGQSFQEGSQNQASSGGVQLPPSQGGSGGSTIPGPGFNPAYSFDFQTTGTGSWYTPAAANITTDTIFNVRVRADGSSGFSIPGVGGSSPTGCIEWEIKIYSEDGNGNLIQNGAGKKVKLSVPGAGYSMCPDEPSEKVISFSERFVNGSATPIHVEVTKAQNDFYCALYLNGVVGQPPYCYNTNFYEPYCGAYYNLQCGDLKNVYQTHMLEGDIEIEVNGTFLP